MSQLSEEQKSELSRQESRRRIQEKRESQARERRAHEEAVAAQSEAAKSDLDRMMESLPKELQREIRLQAYLRILNSNWGTPNNKQAAVDETALALARYVVEGRV